MTDAYSLIKVLYQQESINNFNLIINMSKSECEADITANRILEVAKENLGIKINYLGNIPYDTTASTSIIRQKALHDRTIHTISGHTFSKLAKEITEIPRLIEKKTSENIIANIIEY